MIYSTDLCTATPKKIISVTKNGIWQRAPLNRHLEENLKFENDVEGLKSHSFSSNLFFLFFCVIKNAIFAVFKNLFSIYV